MDIRILKTEDELSLELGRPPTRLEMADRLQITPEEFDRCVWEMSGEISTPWKHCSPHPAGPRVP